nr:hypothetical protein [Tanacetum cinerariifolium]
KIIIDLEDEVVSLLEKEKANLETIESLKSKECDKEENSKVITPGMFKLNVSQCVSPISMSKSSCDSNNLKIKLKRNRRKRKSSKQNVKQVDNDVSRTNSDFVHFLDLDTFSSVRRPKNSGVIWKKKGSSNTSNVVLSAVSLLNLNKNVKRYADNNFFIFDDVNVRISPISKMPFRKKPRDSMNLKELIEMNNDLLAQKKVLKEQLQVKHVVIDTHAECQEKYAKLEAERYEYMIRYSAYFDNDKQHRKQIADQEVLYDKMSVQLVELDRHVRDLKNKI